MVAALPAFALSAVTVRGLARLGVSEVRTFAICTQTHRMAGSILWAGLSTDGLTTAGE